MVIKKNIINPVFLALPEESKGFSGLLSDVSSHTRSESKQILEPFIIKGRK